MDMGARRRMDLDVGLHTETVHGCILPEYRFIKKREGDQPVLWLIILLFCRWFVYVILPGILPVLEDRGSMRLHGWRRKYRSGYRQHRFPYLQRYKRYLQ